MPPEYASRYARHHLIDWWDQGRLTGARILVAGAGALGNEVIKLLALLGVGHLLIVDFDRVEVSNLTRSVLFREGDIGAEKARTAAERAREINPEIEIDYLVGDLEFDVGLGVYRKMDVVIGGLDSIDARLALNRACLRMGVPWLNGGIEATLGEVSYFDGREGACFECAMSPEMWARRNQRFSCGGLRAEAEEAKVPTTATVASLIASYLVNEALCLLHVDSGRNKEGLAASQKLYLMLKPYGFYIYDLPRNPECLAHERWEPIAILTERPQELTVTALLQRLDARESALELGFDLLTVMRCHRCGQEESIFRPLERCGLTLTECPRCHAATRLPETLCRLEADSDYADYTLAQLGIPDYQVVTINTAGERRHVQLSGEYAP